MIRFLLAVLLLTFPVASATQPPSQQNLLQCLMVPDPECGFGWVYQSAFFDPLLSNTEMSLAELNTELREAQRAKDVFRAARCKLDLASVYARIDSLVVSRRYASGALDMLKNHYSYKPSAVCAYHIGRAYELIDRDGDARRCYEQAIALDDEYYPAYFEIVEDLGPFDKEFEPWVRRASEVAEKLRRSHHDRAFRATLAYEYAGLQSSIIGQGTIVGIFDFIAGAVHAQRDSSELDSMIVATFGSLAGFCGETVVNLLSIAAELDPTKAQYQLALAASQLGRSFFSAMIPALMQENVGKGESDALLFQLLSQQHDAVLMARTRLQGIPASEWRRFPAIHYYVAFSDLFLENYPRALDEILAFIRFKPENKHGYSLHCSIVAQLSKQLEVSENEELAGELVAVTERKCREYPTGWDLYRLGVLRYLGDEIAGAQSAFESAMTLDGKDERPRLALAACALRSGDTNKARGIVQSLEDAQLNGKNLVCYRILQSVLAAYGGDIATARHWAEKAKEIDAEAPELTRLLGELK